MVAGTIQKPRAKMATGMSGNAAAINGIPIVWQTLLTGC
jgi:hypothetical protein